MHKRLNYSRCILTWRVKIASRDVQKKYLSVLLHMPLSHDRALRIAGFKFSIFVGKTITSLTLRRPKPLHRQTAKFVQLTVSQLSTPTQNLISGFSFHHKVRKNAKSFSVPATRHSRHCSTEF